MQVYGIQNNNNNPYFGAGFKIYGEKNFVPKALQSKFEQAAASIGTKKDNYFLIIGKPIKTKLDSIRESTLIANMNGDLKSKDIRTCASFGEGNELAAFKEKVLDTISYLA